MHEGFLAADRSPGRPSPLEGDVGFTREIQRLLKSCPRFRCLSSYGQQPQTLAGLGTVFRKCVILKLTSRNHHCWSEDFNHM